MNCLNDGTLRALVDRELDMAESERVSRHMHACAKCRERSERLATQAQGVHGLLTALAPDGGEAAVDPTLAYGRYRETTGSRAASWTVRWNHLRHAWGRPAWGAVAAVSTVALLLTFTPAQTWGQKFLQMLRVQKLAVIPVDLSVLTSGTASHGPGKLIAQLISDSVVVTMNPGEPVTGSSVAAASGLAGFKVRALDQLGEPQRILIAGEGAFHMTLDHDRIQAVLDQAGRSDVSIPASVDGSTVAVHIPKMVRLLYGSCSPQHAQAADAANCIDFAQVPSPTVSVPPTLNMAALAEAGLQATGMSPAEAHAFCQTVDWSSTLVIPIPQNGGTYRTLSVDGVNATLIELPGHGNFLGAYTLIWVKDGVVFSLSGKGSADRAVAAAESLS